MSNLKPPPIPKKSIMIITCVAIVALIAVTLILIISAEKPELSEAIQKLEYQQRKIENDSGKDEKKELENPPIQTKDVKDKHYAKQLEKRREGSTNEAEYLEERRWGFWHLALPMLVIAVFVIIWAKKKHKDWLK